MTSPHMRGEAVLECPSGVVTAIISRCPNGKMMQLLLLNLNMRSFNRIRTWFLPSYRGGDCCRLSTEMEWFVIHVPDKS